MTDQGQETCRYVVRRVPGTLGRPFEQFEQWCDLPIRKNAETGEWECDAGHPAQPPREVRA